jgi:uncharacterized protein (DUF1501 family)
MVFTHARIDRGVVSRRSFLRGISAGAIASGSLGFTDLMNLYADDLRRQGKALILLWMEGGPSQLETFDPKPGHENGGGTAVIDTAVPGIQIAAGWEQTAAMMNDIALIRSLTNREGNHQRATYQLHTGYIPAGGVKHPSFGCCVAERIGDAELDLPSVVSVGRTIGAGFLGVNYEPFVVDNPNQMPANITAAIGEDRLQQRLGLFNQLEQGFADRGAVDAVRNQRELYEKASSLVFSERTRAFDLNEESAETRARYGENNFGQGCLLARRLVEVGVTFVEVRMNGWDTHAENNARTTELASQVDPGFSGLVTDLKDRGMLDRTVVLWLGEFGRTPKVNARAGRDHYPRVFNAAIAGGGVRGGQVIGSSTADGAEVAERPVGVTDLFSSLCHALEVDPTHENLATLGRPLKIVDGGTVVQELFS